jgi:hypothetical protein
MVHKKYTYKKGKRFGPYYYKTKRVNGKVVTTYLGSKDPRKKFDKDKLVKFSVLGLIFGVLLLFIFANQFSLTGKASLDIKSEYEIGEEIEGVLDFVLKEGELIPSDSKLLISLGNQEVMVSLSSLIFNKDMIEGDFYAEGVSISGSGKGFGLSGEREVFPEVSFELRISEDRDKEKKSSGGEKGEEEVIEEQEVEESEKESEEAKESEERVEEPEAEEEEEKVEESEESVEEETVEEEPEESVEESEESSEEPEKSESESEESVKEELAEESLITGEVVSETGRIIIGKVSSEKDFEYELEEKKDVEIANIDVEGADLKLKVSGKKITVKTDYSVISSGFGKDYLGKTELILAINLSEFGLIAEAGELSIELSYEDEVIVKSSEIIGISGPPEATGLGNITTNETIGNETIVEVKNVSSGVNLSINTTQFGAILGKPVKWNKKIILSEASSLSIVLPKDASNVSIVSLVDKSNFSTNIEELEETEEEPEEIVEEEVEELENVGEELEDSEEQVEEFEEITVDSDDSVITGNVVADIKLKKRKGFFDKFLDFFGTGYVIVDERGFAENLTEDDIVLDLNGTISEIEIEYETPPALAEETELKNGKIVKIIGPSDVHYENVLVFSEINESLGIVSKDRIGIIWEKNNTSIPVLSVQDLDENGIFDYVEWVAPVLSNQTFTIIVITKADHLDENREFISDIFEEVKELDDVWSETIFDKEYVRVVFEEELDSTKDITIFPRIVSGNPRIEVYEENGNETVAVFEEIDDKEYNQVFLTELEGEQDTFDLRVLDGDLEFDYIVDPVSLSPSWWTESGETTLTASKTTSVDLSEEVDPSKAFILTSRRTNTDTPFTEDEPSDSAAYVYWVNGTRFEFNKSAAVSGAIYSWYVIEGNFISVQNGTQDYNYSEKGFNITIDSVNISRTVPFMTFASCDSFDPADTQEIFWTGNITSATNLEVTRDSSGACNGSIGYFVVEFNDGSEIQQGQLDNVPANGVNISINSVNLSDTWMYFSNSPNDPATGLDDNGVTVIPANESAYYFDRNNNAAENNRVQWYVITTPGAFVQNGTQASMTVNNITISSVVLNRSFSTLSFDNSGGGTSFGNTMGTSHLLSQTNLNIFCNTGNTQDGKWQVIEFPQVSDADNAVPDVTINFPHDGHYYNKDEVQFNFNVTLSENGSVEYNLYDLEDSAFQENTTMFAFGGDIFGTELNSTNDTLEDGRYTFIVYANDTAGNTNITENVTFNFDGKEPTVNFTDPTPANGSALNDSDTLFVNLSSNDSSDHFSFVDFNRDLVLWMGFDYMNTSGSGDASDLSSWSNNATTFGNVVFNGTSGYFGNGSDFDGDGDYVQFLSTGLPASLDSKNNISVFAWINARDHVDGAGGLAIIGQCNGVGTVGQYAMAVGRHDNELSILWGNADIDQSTASLVENVWYHVGFTREGKTGDWTSKIYIDGALDETRTDITTNPGDELNLAIGRCGNFAALLYFDGYIDEVMIFNRTLDANEIASLYNASSNQYFNNFTVTPHSGAQTFTGYSVDRAGNRNNTDEYLVNLSDTLPPGVTINFPNDGHFYHKNEKLFNFNVTLSEKGKAIYNLYDHEDSAYQVNTTMFAFSAETIGSELNSTNNTLEDGRYTFIAYGNDIAENLNITENVTFNFDGKEPTVNFTDPTPANDSVINSTTLFVNLSSNDSSDHYSFVDFNKDLLLWMTFDEMNTSGSGDPTDLSSWSNNGTSINDVVFNRTGWFGNRSYFDGIGDYIDVANDTELDFDPDLDYTWSAWVNFQENDGEPYHCWISKSNRGTNGFNLCINTSASSATAYICNYVSAKFTCEGKAIAATPGVWTHLAVVFTTPKNWEFFENGTSLGTSVVTPLSDVVSSYFIGSGGNITSEPEYYFNGSIDELLIFNRSLDSDEIKALYNASSNQFFNNYTLDYSGEHTFTGYSVDRAGNRNNTDEYLVIKNTQPDDAASITLNSTDGSNQTGQNLEASAVITDPDGDAMNVSVLWFEKGGTVTEELYNTTFTNGSTFNATLDSSKTARYENWTVGFVLFDGIQNSSLVNSTNTIYIENTPPSVTLSTPANGSETADRRPTFSWSVSDPDGEDTITKEILFQVIGGGTCTDPITSGTVAAGSGSSYEITQDLQCFKDNGDEYNWTVRANDGVATGEYADSFNLSINSVIAVSMNISVVEFGDINYEQSNNTEDDFPPAFVIENDGTVNVNITISATDLWSTQTNPSIYYQYKVDNVTSSGENDSFDNVLSTMTYANMPSVAETFLVALNYTNATDSAEIDINITVPTDEGPLVRESTVTFTASLGEG